MANSVLDTHTNFIKELAEFVDRLKQTIKARSAVNTVCAHLGISRSMYYQRLRYPQNMDQQEIVFLAKLLQEPDLLKSFQQTQQAGNRLAAELAAYLREARLTTAFISRTLRIHPTTFYRKQKEPRLWTRKQLEQIVQVVEIIRR